MSWREQWHFTKRKLFIKWKSKVKLLFPPKFYICELPMSVWFAVSPDSKVKFYCDFLGGETAFNTTMKRAAFSSNQIEWNLKTFAPKIGWEFWRDSGILNWWHLKFVSLAPGECEHGTLIICHLKNEVVMANFSLIDRRKVFLGPPPSPESLTLSKENSWVQTTVGIIWSSGLPAFPC